MNAFCVVGGGGGDDDGAQRSMQCRLVSCSAATMVLAGSRDHSAHKSSITACASVSVLPTTSLFKNCFSFVLALALARTVTPAGMSDNSVSMSPRCCCCSCARLRSRGRTTANFLHGHARIIFRGRAGRCLSRARRECQTWIWCFLRRTTWNLLYRRSLLLLLLRSNCWIRRRTTDTGYV